MKPRRFGHDLTHDVRRYLCIVEFCGAMLRGQQAGDVTRQEVLELDVAGAIQDRRRCEIDNDYPPNTERENQALGA